MTRDVLKRRIDALERRLIPRAHDGDVDHLAWTKALTFACFMDFEGWGRLHLDDVTDEERIAEMNRRLDAPGLRAFLDTLASSTEADEALERVKALVSHRKDMSPPDHAWGQFLWDVKKDYYKNRYHGDPPELTDEQRLALVRRSIAVDWASGAIRSPFWERRREGNTP